MKTCPHCEIPESKLRWGPEGTRFEDCWSCKCGGHGIESDLIETEENDGC